MTELELKKRAQRLADRLNAMGFTKNGKPLVIDQAFELVAAEEGFRNQHVLRAQMPTGIDAAVTVFAEGVKAAGYGAKAVADPLVIPRLPDDAFINAILVDEGPHSESDIALAFDAWQLIVAEAAKRAGTEPVTAETEAAAERAWVNVVNAAQWSDLEEVLHLEGFIRNAGLMGELAKYAQKVAAEEGVSVPPLPPVDTPMSRAREEARQRQLVEDAFMDHEFSKGVIDFNGWEHVSGTGEFKRAVFLESDDGGDSIKVTFYAKVIGSTVETSVLRD